MRSSQPWRTNRARVLRARQTTAEDIVWSKLRDRQLGDLKFMRQMPIGRYFADFACRERKLIVEIDGGTHSTEAEIARDDVRRAFFEARGWRVFRAHNDECFDNIDGVLDTLLAFAEGKTA